MTDLLFSQGTAKQNMERDASLLKNVGDLKRPLLHLYRWKEASFTHGYFCQPQKILHEHKIKKYRLNYARRSTGGGICFHLSDYAFSFLMPASHPNYSLGPMANYHFVNVRVQKALKRFVGLKTDLIGTSSEGSTHFCSTRATKYDLVYKGKKVGGAAQRQTKEGYLHQGTLFLKPPPWDIIEDILIEGKALRFQMENMCHFVCDPLSDLEQNRNAFESLLIEEFHTFG